MSALSVFIMKLNLLVLHMSILTMVFLPLKADVEDPDCETLINVHRNTVYRESLGKTLRINCSVTFCNNPPPTITWNRHVNNKNVPVSVTNNGRIQTQWKKISDLEGTSFLFFKNTLGSDAGIYWCQGGGSVSHTIEVQVYDDEQRATMAATTETRPPDTDWTYVYWIAAIIGCVIIMVIMYATCKCKGEGD
ncbi:uncharacterized protein V6R79_011316 [Siganus canaliculatus]